MNSKLKLGTAIVSCMAWLGLRVFGGEGGAKWPATTPPDKTNPYWEFNNNLSVNNVQYHKVEVSPGQWEWRENAAANKAISDDNLHRRELMAALQSRVLTDKEMAEVTNYGRSLNIYSGEVYMEADKQRELNEALLQQFRLRQNIESRKQP